MSLSFIDLGVSPGLVSRLNAVGITTPFPIQQATLPDALAGRDVCGRAPTGSGKTLAFGLAVVTRAVGSTARRPRALVLVPTRELASQVQRELAALTADGGRRVIAVYGGTGYNETRRALARGVDVIVACPGRLEDLLAQRALDLGDVRCVVLDEADRMADMGFLPAVRRILDLTPDDRQVLLFSATLGNEIEALVHRYQADPVRHDVEGDDKSSVAVEHRFLRTPRDGRIPATTHLVREHGQALIFCRTKRGVDRVARQLNNNGVKSVAIHGDRTQSQRERALDTFATGGARALVATDVAARGIHVDSLPCVVHYDLPADHTEYLHRSGRTGRAGKTGTVVSLVTEDQHQAVRALQRSLGLDVRLEAPGAAATVPTSVSPKPVTPKTSDPDRGQTPDVRARVLPSSASKPPAGRSPSRPTSRKRIPRPVRQGAAVRTGPATGTVEFFDARKGYGFLSHPGSPDDVFVHASSIQGEGKPVLVPGQQVRFDIAPGQRGNEARRVTVVRTGSRPVRGRSSKVSTAAGS